jgi:hypothetical protein
MKQKKEFIEVELYPQNRFCLIIKDEGLIKYFAENKILRYFTYAEPRPFTSVEWCEEDEVEGLLCEILKHYKRIQSEAS